MRVEREEAPTMDFPPKSEGFNVRDFLSPRGTVDTEDPNSQIQTYATKVTRTLQLSLHISTK